MVPLIESGEHGMWTVLQVRTLLLILGLSVACRCPAISQPDLTQDQAASRAQAFLKAIGEGESAKMFSATYPAPKRFSAQIETHWQARWRLLFKSDGRETAEFEIVSKSAVVSRFYNFALVNKLQNEERPPGQALTEADILRRAEEVIRATGQTDELSSAKATLQQTTNPPTAAGHLWVVSWVRKFHGIPFRNQQATLILLADTGAVVGLGLTYHSPPPTSVQVVVNREHALSVARTHLAANGVQNAGMKQTILQIVQPNSFWLPGGSSKPIGPASMVAWACMFNRDQDIWEVWIDAKNGSVIGGEIHRVRKPSAGPSNYQSRGIR